jgi:SAM-dependent methyltransferase
VKRIPEPELMDTEEQARAYAFADFEAPHSHAIELLGERHSSLPAAGTAVDLGCGPADVSIRFARAFPSWCVHGLDGSAAMLSYGREAVARALLAERVLLFEARLPHEPAPLESYDLILSSSVLHHLDDPAALWTSVRRWGQPGTPVFVFDLLRPQTVERAHELVDENISGEPEVLQRDFRNSLFAAYSLDEVRRQLVAAQLDSTLRAEQVSNRHLIVWGTT